MKTLKISTMSFALALLLSLSACEKEGPPGPAGTTGEQGPRGKTGAAGPKGDKGDTGSTGVAGPKGATGAKGPKGDKGDKGDQGAPGTANVMYSGWMDIVWTTNTSSQKMMVIPEPALNEAFFNNGGIFLMYIKTSGTPISAVLHLPLKHLNGVIDYGVQLGSPGQEIIFFVEPQDGSSPLDPGLNLTGVKIQYMLIPGGIQLSNGKKANDLKWSQHDFNTVQQLLK